VELENTSQGPADSVNAARSEIDPNAPIVIANSDQIVLYGLSRFYNKLLEGACDGCVLTMLATGTKWSFAEVNERNRVLRIAENKEISKTATVGIYGWKLAEDFFKSFDNMVMSDDRTNNEYYVAPTYNYLLQSGKTVESVNIGAVETQVFGLGTPQDLKMFIESSLFKGFSVSEQGIPDRLNQLRDFFN
jgi:NDP-sugar pyrophosphorylase family protein